MFSSTAASPTAPAGPADIDSKVGRVAPGLPRRTCAAGGGVTIRSSRCDAGCAPAALMPPRSVAALTMAMDDAAEAKLLAQVAGKPSGPSRICALLLVNRDRVRQ